MQSVLLLRTATLRQLCIQENARLTGMPVEDYMRAVDIMPCTDFVDRPDLDPVDAEYMHAAQSATAKQRELEAMSAEAGLSVEEYMAEHGMLTDTHLAPWAR